MFRSMRPLFAALVSVLLLASLAVVGCNRAPDAVATVNGVAIPASQLGQVYTQVAKQQSATPTVSQTLTLRAQILNNLIQAELVRQEGKRLGIDVTSKQIDDYLAKFAAQYGGESQLKAMMEQQGVTLEQVRDSILIRLTTDAMMDKVAATSTVNVTDAQVSDYYKANKAEFATPAEVHAQHVLIPATETVLAQQVFAKAKAGVSFAELAKQYSQDPGSAGQGGDLGWAAPDNYVPAFAKAVKTMKVGQILLVQSNYGWHVVKLLGRRPARVQPLAEATAQIRDTLIAEARNAKIAAYVEALRKKADVVINDAALKAAVDRLNASEQTQTPTP